MPQQTEAQRQAAFQAAGMQPAAQTAQPIAAAPVTPTPQMQTPAAPQVNVNVGQPQQSPQTTTSKQTSPTGANTALQMPSSGSVVDLLSMAGQDSSFAARSQLAKQYGIQGYTGTAAQNQELSKKFLDTYNNLKGTQAPQSGAEARTALTTYQDQADKPVLDPTQQFMDSYAAMNPIEANLFQQLSTLAATPMNQQSLVEFYQQEVAAQGIEGLNMELADINRIMEGTEDDIRDEVTNAGGFVTDSQVQALAGARNKTLLRKAQYLTDVINSKNEYVDRIVSLTQADRKQVSEDLDRKLGITKTLIDMSQQMTRNAKENYMAIVDSVGWGGLAEMTADSPEQQKRVESLFGLAPDELKALAAYKKPLTAEEELRNKNLELQNKKLIQDINTPKESSVSTQVVDLGGKKVLINSKTGAIIKEFGEGENPTGALQLAQAQSDIGTIDSLLANKNIKTAVAPNRIGTLDVADFFTAGKSDFIAEVEKLSKQLTLNSLINAKANGATFGALSEGELRLLDASATKINTWAQKDNAGNVKYYKTTDASFKKELDSISNFAKLDYVLKGGDPASVGVEQMADGTLWTKNSDGTYTQIR